MTTNRPQGYSYNKLLGPCYAPVRCRNCLFLIFRLNMQNGALSAPTHRRFAAPLFIPRVSLSILYTMKSSLHSLMVKHPKKKYMLPSADGDRTKVPNENSIGKLARQFKISLVRTYTWRDNPRLGENP